MQNSCTVIARGAEEICEIISVKSGKMVVDLQTDSYRCADLRSFTSFFAVPAKIAFFKQISAKIHNSSYTWKDVQVALNCC